MGQHHNVNSSGILQVKGLLHWHLRWIFRHLHYQIVRDRLSRLWWKGWLSTCFWRQNKSFWKFVLNFWGITDKNKAKLPNDVVHTDGTSIAPSVVQDHWPVSKTLYTTKAILKIQLNVGCMGSQLRTFLVGVLCEYLVAHQTIWERLFWTHCNLCKSAADTLLIKELQ